MPSSVHQSSNIFRFVVAFKTGNETKSHRKKNQNCRSHMVATTYVYLLFQYCDRDCYYYNDEGTDWQN